MPDRTVQKAPPEMDILLLEVQVMDVEMDAGHVLEPSRVSDGRYRTCNPDVVATQHPFERPVLGQQPSRDGANTRCG